MTRPVEWLRWLALLAGWLLLSVGLAVVLFLGSSRTLVVASHQAVVSPSLSGQIVLHTGAVLPDLRLPTGRALGVDVVLGKTQAASTQELVQRYAFIGSHPDGQVAAVEAAVWDMWISAALRGALLGAVPIGVWLLIGRARRVELARSVRSPRGIVVVSGVGVLSLLLLLQPWHRAGAGAEDVTAWTPLAEFAGTSLPAELSDVEMTTDVMTTETRRLVLSAITAYRTSKEWYAAAAVTAAELDLRQAESGETVALVVSDRHDNVGMDPVARAVGDAAGATVVLDAGDDTSGGEFWEAFSLDSLDRAFAGYDRYFVAGNHDHGPFVDEYLADLGWTHLDGTAVEGPGGSVLWGVDDPRASGLGRWMADSAEEFADAGPVIADEVCSVEDRVATLLVHDAALGREALRRGCADLVIGGHLHVFSGPVRVEGENGEVGYTLTNGTTGGAAYSIAVGSTLRRAAEMTLVTYRDGRPVGVQEVTLQTTGRFDVAPWVPLAY